MVIRQLSYNHFVNSLKARLTPGFFLLPRQQRGWEKLFTVKQRGIRFCLPFTLLSYQTSNQIGNPFARLFTLLS
ncbi:hypothetical protein LG52_2336 [Geobacillus kaustophilus]|uniref:Uncharacterized protein n=1 Tax=Geobacillus kaustophilus TaxID=1462 RepID=A0A0D8C0M2_GEOKU|nr:hypothetical protein LG52_2336 [Geobacillus kaustophilus]